MRDFQIFYSVCVCGGVCFAGGLEVSDHQGGVSVSCRRSEGTHDRYTLSTREASWPLCCSPLGSGGRYWWGGGRGRGQWYRRPGQRGKRH